MMRRVWYWVMGCVAVVLLFAPFFAPYSEDQQNRLRTEEKPTPIGLQHGWPVVEEDGQVYRLQFMARDQGRHLWSVPEPGRLFLLGTDEYGRDVFSRFLYGGRVSLAGGLLATSLALVLACALGATAGLQGGWADEALMRASELFLSLPWLYLLLALRAVLPLQISRGWTFGLVVTVIALSGWAKPARLIRGMVLSAKERPYVQVARAMGAGNVYLFAYHIVPQLKGLLRAQALLILPQFVLADIALSFLGLGAGEPAASWGGMLAGLRHFATLESHWGHVAAAILMILFFLGMQSLATEPGEETEQRHREPYNS